MKYIVILILFLSACKPCDQNKKSGSSNKKDKTEKASEEEPVEEISEETQ